MKITVYGGASPFVNQKYLDTAYELGKELAKLYALKCEEGKVVSCLKLAIDKDNSFVDKALEEPLFSNIKDFIIGLNIINKLENNEIKIQNEGIDIDLDKPPLIIENEKEIDESINEEQQENKKKKNSKKKEIKNTKTNDEVEEIKEEDRILNINLSK